jgi:hypothetical protein
MSRRTITKGSSPQPARGDLPPGDHAGERRDEQGRSAGPQPRGLTHSPGPATRERLYADILPEGETPAMLNEAVRRWREGTDG